MNMNNFKLFGTMFRLLIVLVMVSVLNGQSLGGPTHGKKMLCYYSDWAYYYPVPGQPRFQGTMIDPTLCTHIVYFSAFYDIEKNIIRSKYPELDLKKNGGIGNYLTITSLKEKYPHLKVLIAVGDLINGPTAFSKMASDPEIRKIFVRNVKRFMRRFGFDGLDFNWFYPTFKGGAHYDRDNFVQLAKELSEAFKPRGYILAATIGVIKSTLDAAYDLKNLSSHLDLVHLRAWNYHDYLDGYVGASAPLRGTDDDDTDSVEFTVDYVISHDVPPHKLVMSFAFHGRSYILRENLNYVDFGENPVLFDGFKGLYSNLAGFMNYHEICLELSNTSSPWRYNWDDNSETPYLRDQKRVISYDNAKSIASKIRLAIEKGFGGFSGFTMDMDDYLGTCAPESHHEEEAYEGFIERLDNIAGHSALNDALKNLNLADENQFHASNSPTYVTSNGKLKLRRPKEDPKPVKFKLTRLVNDFITLVIQEKRIFDEIKRIKEEKLQR